MSFYDCATSESSYDIDFTDISRVAGVKEGKVVIPDGTVYYVTAGHGPNHLLFMPGGLGIVAYFGPQLKELDREKFTVIAWSPPGNGRSGKPIKEQSWNFYEEYAENAYELMQALGIRKYALLGWCGGGRLAIIHAAKHPECVTKLVMFGTNPVISEREFGYHARIRDMKSWSGFLGKYWRPIKVAECGGDIEETNRLWQTRLDLIKKLYEVKNGEICYNYLDKIECPVLVLHGEMDPVIQTETVLQYLQKIKNVRLYCIPDGKHEIHFTHKKEFNSIVEEFLLED